MLSAQPRRILLTIPLAVFACSLSARADKIEVVDASLPVPFLASSTQTVDDQIEASALEPIDDGKLLLVAHDKTADLRIVERDTGRIVGVLDCGVFPRSARDDPKWEAMARDDDGWYYVIGSHSGVTSEERARRSHLVRFRLEGGTGRTPWTIEGGSVRRWHIADALVAALMREGLDAASVAKHKIEGLAVRTRRAQPGALARVQLIIGLREPDDLVRAFAADITTPPAPEAKLSLTRVFAFEAPPREGVRAQLTSLLDVPAWSGLLAITTTEDTQNVFHGNTLWFIPDAQLSPDSVVTPQPVWIFEPAMKAEGLCLLPRNGNTPNAALGLALIYDNDAKKTHIPSRLQTITLIRTEH
jgi:hypothetical protein